jgi:GDSL-like Lipase/Acylhydrolase family
VVSNDPRTTRWQWLGALTILAAGIVVVWLVVDELIAAPQVDVVGDSITALSQPAIASSLAKNGFNPVIDGVVGIRIAQAAPGVSQLAQNQPFGWVIELGTNDAGGGNTQWMLPFLSVWRTISAARCVVYVTVSPRDGAIAAGINAAIRSLAQSHSNVHVLDWGNLEYTQSGWVEPDEIHPTPAGQAALAYAEATTLQKDCLP